MNLKTLVIMGFCLALMPLAQAHEPTDMDISYSALTGALNITVFHKVNSTTVHYINKMEIYLNRQGIELQDRLIISQKFFSQPIRNEQRAQYTVRDLNPGDILKIKASCNLFGEIEKILTITSENWQESPKP